jgi:hypothetical protein
MASAFFPRIVAFAWASLAPLSAAIAGCDYDGKPYSTPQAACAALLLTKTPPERVKLAELERGTGQVHCVGSPPEEGITPFDMWVKLCTEDTVSTAPQGDQPDPYECGMRADHVKAMKAWMGKPFTSVPALDAAWKKAMREGDAQSVSQLKPDPGTNKAARDAYFEAAKKRFWRVVFKDTGEGGARALLQGAGFVFGNAGAGPVATVGGAPMTLNIDHIVRLSDDPAKMLSPDNLRLTSAKENQRVLEGIRARDVHQDPKAYLEKVASNGGKPPKVKGRNDVPTADCPEPPQLPGGKVIPHDPSGDKF